MDSGKCKFFSAFFSVFFRFSGIYRSVYIYYVPEVHVEDIRIRPQVDESLTKGVLQVDLRMRGSGCVRLSLTDPANHDRVLYDSGTIRFSQEQSVSETSPAIVSPRLWSAEKPNLYTLHAEVFDSDGNLVESLVQNVGFRRFELRDGLMLLNGKRIAFKGVNRHEFSSETGRVVSDEELLQDIITMKRNNINAIRTCHYPDDVRIYDLCDRYGLYMIAENNMETHGSWIMHDQLREVAAGRRENDTEVLREMKSRRPSDPIPDCVVPGDDERWAPLLLDRINSCYQRDKNHPSILIWSIGNESYGGPVLQKMTDLFHELDPDRLVQYEGIFHDRRYPATSDIESQMYPSVADIRNYLKQYHDKPFICCEYTHAMGNSCGAMHWYTDLAYEIPYYQGGFIWDYIDQSLCAKNRFGEEYQAYGGDFGDRPSSYEFSGNGIVYGDDRTPSPKMQEVRYNYQNISIDISDGKACIINRNLFTRTGEYDCVVEWLHDGIRIGEKAMEIDIAPDAPSEQYDLPFFGEETQPGDYTLRLSFLTREDQIPQPLFSENEEETGFLSGRLPVALPAGHEVAFGEWSYIHEQRTDFLSDEYLYGEKKDGGSGPAVGDAVPSDSCSGQSEAGACADKQSALEIIPGEENIGVRGAHFSVLFSGERGGIVSYEYKGKQLLNRVSRPNFWRAMTDNDRGARSDMQYAQWKIASLYQEHRTPEFFAGGGPEMGMREDGCFFLKLKYLLATCPVTSVDVAYRVAPDGRITMEMDYEPPVSDSMVTGETVDSSGPVQGSGEENLRSIYDPSAWLRESPEFGFLFTLDADYDQVQWFGSGPEETYADRKQGGKTGVYQNRVMDNMARYLVPQECGNKENVRYIQVTDEAGDGLIFATGTQADRENPGFSRSPLMCASVLPYTPHELDNATHACELPPVHHTIVRVSAAQMGVGGDDSWGAQVHPVYRVDMTKPMHFEVSFRGIRK